MNMWWSANGNENIVTRIQGKMVQTSALLSAFLSKSRMNFADFTGQRPCPFEWRFLACAVRPTPRQKRWNGIACLWAKTSSRYLLALPKGNFRIACAVSLVFWMTGAMDLSKYTIEGKQPPQEENRMQRSQQRCYGIVNLKLPTCKSNNSKTMRFKIDMESTLGCL